MAQTKPQLAHLTRHTVRERVRGMLGKGAKLEY